MCDKDLPSKTKFEEKSRFDDDCFEFEFFCQATGTGTWDLGLGTWDLGLGTWDLGPGTWDLGPRT